MNAPDTYTLDQLHAYCVRNGYPDHAQTLQGYRDKRNAERLERIYSQPQPFTGDTKAWREVVANRRAAA